VVMPVAYARCRSLLSFSSRDKLSSVSPPLEGGESTYVNEDTGGWEEGSMMGWRAGGREGGRSYVPVWVQERSLVGDQPPKAGGSSEYVRFTGSEEEEKCKHVRDQWVYFLFCLHHFPSSASSSPLFNFNPTSYPPSLPPPLLTWWDAAWR